MSSVFSVLKRNMQALDFHRLRFLFFYFFIFSFFPVAAQVGEHRNDLSVGFNGGMVLSNVSFLPKVPQNMHMGLTGGLTFRYVSEKYFSSICAVTAEVNYAQIGWKESILTRDDEPVINDATELPEEYQRNITYVQVPVFARLGWGRERQGFQAYFQIGPQVGCYLSEKTVANFDLDHPNSYDRVSKISGPNIEQNGVVYEFSNMYHMPVENKFDYGIAAGLGLEFSHPKIGHFLLEGRYYYGLGNLYGNTKRDYFSLSNLSNIVVKLTYLYDLKRTRNPKIR